MPPKPHRLLLDRVSGYADEASAYLRRRKIIRKPFARVHWAGGRSAAFDPETAEGRELFRAAAKLIDVAGDGELSGAPESSKGAGTARGRRSRSGARARS